MSWFSVCFHYLASKVFWTTTSKDNSSRLFWNTISFLLWYHTMMLSKIGKRLNVHKIAMVEAPLFARLLMKEMENPRGHSIHKTLGLMHITRHKRIPLFFWKTYFWKIKVHHRFLRHLVDCKLYSTVWMTDHHLRGEKHTIKVIYSLSHCILVYTI